MPMSARRIDLIRVWRGGRALTIVVAAIGLATTNVAARTARADPRGTQSLEQGADRTESPASADDVQQEIDELRRRLDLLAAEVERLRSGEVPADTVELTDDRRRALGLAPSASAIYRTTQGVSIAGYGEMLYENFDRDTQQGQTGSKTSRLDFLRHIVYVGYRFDDRFLFNSEIEIEHADEISVEFAHLDVRVNDSLTVRGGMMLMPLGLVNEFHEPTAFLGARRPQTERRIIPSTWRENGAGVVGSVDRFAYRAYVVNGLNAAGFTAAGLRGGRQKGSKADAADVAFAGRLDFRPTPGVFVGTGLYTGGSDQGRLDLNGRSLDVGTTIVEVHGQAQVRGWDLRALYAHASLGDVAELNAVRGLDTTGVSESMQGGYLQIGYDVLSQFSRRIGMTPYYRWERLNTQSGVPTGFLADLSQDGTFHTFGVEVRPRPGIVVKSDYEWLRNAARTGRNQFNLSLGYAF